MTLNKKQSSLSSLNHHEFSHGSLAYMINNLDLSKKENIVKTILEGAPYAGAQCPSCRKGS